MSADPRFALPGSIAQPAEVGLRPADPGTRAGTPEAPPAVVVQILATEHWSLLATRSMLWGELMSRISIHLTISSAALVVLALVAQATGFGPGFGVMAIGLSSALLILGTLTLLRVTLGSLEDHRLVAGMNRLRGGYEELSDGVLERFVTSPYDDRAGIHATYALGAPRPIFQQALSSTLFFIACFNAIVAGVLAALITFVAGGPTALVVVLGALFAFAYVGAHSWLSSHLFRDPGDRPLKPTPT